MAAICVDSVFLMALYTPRDQHHEMAAQHFRALFGEDSLGNALIVPWPILYESLNTRLARHANALEKLNRDWTILRLANRLSLRSDASYRDEALREMFEDTSPRRRALSLVDRVVRAILSSHQAGVDAFVTYNAADFADTCALYNIILIDQHISSPASILD
jgi:predicted nucleic acid-binding protein